FLPREWDGTRTLADQHSDQGDCLGVSACADRGQGLLDWGQLARVYRREASSRPYLLCCTEQDKRAVDLKEQRFRRSVSQIPIHIQDRDHLLGGCMFRPGILILR